MRRFGGGVAEGKEIVVTHSSILGDDWICSCVLHGGRNRGRGVGVVIRRFEVGNVRVSAVGVDRLWSFLRVWRLKQ